MGFRTESSNQDHRGFYVYGSEFLRRKREEDLWPFSQKFLHFLVRFSVKNFVREILRAFHKRIRSLFNLKISLTRNSSLATVSNGLILRWKLSQLKMNPGFHSQKTYYIPQFINIEWNQCDARVLETDVTITTCVQK